MKVSVIIPCYNVDKYIEECINSVLSQSYKNIEVIVVNDGSTDSTLEKISKFISDSRITIINQNNKGVSMARDIGLKKSTGDLITFIDSDDKFVDSNTICYMVSKWNKTYDYIGFQHSNYYDGVPEKNYIKLLNIAMSKLKFGKIYNGNWSIWGKLYKKEFIKNCKKNSLWFGEDLAFFMENYTEDYKFYRRKIIKYRITSGSVTRSGKDFSNQIEKILAIETSSKFDGCKRNLARQINSKKIVWRNRTIYWLIIDFLYVIFSERGARRRDQ